MQDEIVNHQHLHTSTKLHSAKERLRRLRRGIINPFRRSTDHTSILGMPFVNSPDQWSDSLHISSTTPPHLSSDSSAASFSRIMDGTNEKTLKKNQIPQGRPYVSSIFVHAGAGYHSTTNEHIHLGACNDSARLAMRILRAGGTAVDAVEAAIKVLEDKEITNAGFGSNLSIEGIVECDATIVDHLGRSGACGATAQIRNPIHLARVILDASNKPLSLRRVPPNLLVGQGATDFAYEHGIPVVPHDMVVSKNARDRYVRWRDDLRRAERGRMTPGTSSATSSQAGEEEVGREYEERVRSQQRRDHMNAILHGTWNEGQPDSPQPSPTLERHDHYPTNRRSPSSSAPSNDPCSTASVHARSHSPDGSPSKRPRYGKNLSDSHVRTHSLLGPNSASTDICKAGADATMAVEALDFSHEFHPRSSDGPTSPAEPSTIGDLFSPLAFVQEGTAESRHERLPITKDEDLITDTVGAIAIDMYGNIAAGSSSGGIGMKHRGRVGPAALVGIGTAVVPIDERDPESVCVAAVTSGTGEHMATTLASQKCAERLYHNTRRAQGGADIEATEEEAMQSFVLADFMGHPGVSGSNSAGAIGVMAVKKTPYGYFLHFAHNTDSFALASMHSNEKEPKCVMSRIGEHGNIVQGGRKIRVD